jgi:hypothetical protein
MAIGAGNRHTVDAARLGHRIQVMHFTTSLPPDMPFTKTFLLSANSLKPKRMELDMPS